ncbi:MAG: hypothetical protein J6Z11_11415 [Candidatus Riflebacteria bacterium]|nr:hypothetical protein [Candidatus Riflebacteria bacterium]
MTINYPTFLNKVDQITSTCDANALKSFIHEFARTVPESNREKFLTTLNDFCNINEDAHIRKKELDSNLEEHIDSILEALEEIQKGDRELEAEINEEWDDWYNGDTDADAYNFSDSDDILYDISTATELLHKSLDHENYKKGAELARILSELKVHVSGEYLGGTLGIEKLIYYNLLNIDLEKTVKEALYLVCMGSKEQDRGEAMLTIMDNFGFYNVSLDEILQMGAHEIDLNYLLPLWINALAKRPAKISDDLLEEAQNMLQDKKAVLDNASRYAENHPTLYRNILAIKDESPEELLLIGLRGMNEVPINSKIRSDICILTAKYALEIQNQKTAEYCWLEAFRSSPTIKNYFQIRFQSENWENYANKVKDIYSSYYTSKDSWEKKSLAALMFFDERFDEMISKFMKAGNGIGWSSSFMKGGIALMLLLLDSGETKGSGISEMIEIALHDCSFNFDLYREGLDLRDGALIAAKFSECFQKWKSQIVLQQTVCESWLEKINQWLALRVSAIMEANRRGCYDECAAFVAAYGEVLESRGKPGEKARIMQKYKKDYSRRRAFHEALINFGME